MSRRDTSGVSPSLRVSRPNTLNAFIADQILRTCLHAMEYHSLVKGDLQAATVWAGRAIEILPAPRAPGVRSPLGLGGIYAGLWQIEPRSWSVSGVMPRPSPTTKRSSPSSMTLPRLDPDESPQLASSLPRADQSPSGRPIGAGSPGRAGPRHSQGKDGLPIWLLDDLLRRGLRPRRPGAIGAPGPGKTHGRTPTACPTRLRSHPGTPRQGPRRPANSRG